MFGGLFKKKQDDKGPDNSKGGGDEEKKDDEEKKEDEEEVPEDDDDDSVEDAAVEDEDDPSLFPLEAQEWARNTLGDASFAKYYQIAKHRTDSDAVEMLTKRKWRVRIKNLHFLNMDKEHDIFLRFSFGTDFRVSRRFVRQKGQVTGQAKPGTGKGSGSGKPPAVVKQFEWQVKGDVGVVLLTTVKRGVEKGQAVDFDDEFTFGWRGSYFDLFKKKLHVEVWDWNFSAPNEYVASYERTLREICSDPMDQEWTIFNQVRKRGKVENVNVGSLKFTVIVEEVLEYTLKLSNWQSTLDVKQFMELEDESRDIVPFAVFNLHYPIHSFRSRQRVVSREQKLVVHDTHKWLKVPFGQLREMTFTGTRLQLEDGELFVSVYDDRTSGFNTSVFSRPLAHCVIPLKAVMEIGVLSSELTKTVQAGGGGVLSKLNVFMGPRVKTALSVVNGSLQQARQAGKKAVVQLTGRIATHANDNGPGGKLTVESAQCGFVRGNLDVEVLPKRSVVDFLCGFPEIKYSLWREFAQVGEPNPPELRDYPPYYQTYLCVRVVSARNLFPADDTGFSDPYVIVKWGDQELKTRIVRETLRPDFLEDLIFLVRSNDPQNIKSEDLAKNPVIHISVMDFDPAGSSDMLGHTRVYLHQITGCGTVSSNGDGDGADEEDEAGRRIPTRPVSSVYIRRRTNPAAPLRPATIQTRVFRSELKLEDLPPDYKSTISVECYFRTWEGDLKERDARIRKLTHTDLVVLPPTKQLFLEKNTPCMCHPVFTLESKASEALQKDAQHWTLRRVMCESSRPPSSTGGARHVSLATETAHKRCDTILAFSHLLEHGYSLPSRSELYRMEMEQDPPRDPRKRTLGPAKRKLDTCKDASRREIPLREFLGELGCEDFLGRDVYGKPHWLPQFVYALTPPKAMIQDPEERKYMVIVSSKLPNAQYAAAQMVKGIEFWDQNDYHMANFSPDTWVDPGTLLSMKKADLKAHAMLLCSLFLGLQTDAYVCLGYARTEPSQLDVTELREKAREDHWPSKKFKVELEKLRGKPKPYVWVMTRESSGEEYGEAFKNVGSVKFWDVTRGGYYAPLPARWKGQNDEELFKIFKSTKAKRQSAAATASAHAAAAADHQDEAEGGGGEETVSPVRSPDLDERVRSNARMAANAASAPARRFAVGARGRGGAARGGAGAVMREEDLLAGDDLLGDVQVAADDVFGLGMMMGGTGSAGTAMAAGGEDEDEHSAAAAASVSSRSGRRAPPVVLPAAFQRRHDTSLLSLQSSGWAARIKQILGERQANCDELLRDSLPFTELVCVFNHKNLWVNAQRYLHPADITYDFGGDNPGWVAVLNRDASEHIVPFYPPKTLGPKLTEDKSSELRTQVEEELESGITNFRSSRSIGTRFAGREMKKLIRKYLETAHAYESMDFSPRNGWDVDLGEFSAGSVGFELQLMKDRLLETLVNTVPPGFTFRFGTAYFHSSDPTDIRKRILSHVWRTEDLDWVKETVEGKDRDPVFAHENRRRAMHEENHDGREVFSVAANVFAYYAQIIIVRVAIIVIFPMTNKA